MSLKIKVMRVGKGDCIWLRYGKETKANIIIDSGTTDTLNEFKNIVDSIQKFNEVVNLLILTHIDGDHINGFRKYIEKNDCKIIGEVWFHGKGAKAYVSSSAHSPKNATMLLDKMSSKKMKVTQVYKHEKYSINDAEFYMLTPTKEAVLKVGKIIDKVYKPHRSGIHNQDLDYIYENDKYEKDNSYANGASISFLFSYEGKCIAFLGDAHAEEIIDNNIEILRRTNIDFAKLPHHGSPNNVSEELINLLGCCKFIISTNQTVEKKTIARIVHSVDKCKLYCNYSWFNRNSYFTEKDKEEYIKTEKLVMKELNKDEFWNIGDEKD